MAKVAITISPKIVKNGGPITKDVYKSHATDLWSKGALLKLSSGLLVPCVDTKGGDAEIDTDDIAALRLFLALSDHLTEESVFVAVQELTPSTVLEVQILASSTTAPRSAGVSNGTGYAGYQLQYSAAVEGNGLWGLDVDDTTNPILNVIDVQTNYEPFRATADYDRVYVKLYRSAFVA